MLYRFGRRMPAVAALLALPVLTAPCSSPPATEPAVEAEPMVEARAVWVNRFEYNSPADVREIVQRVAAANFNVIYFQVRGQGDAYYRSALEPCAIRLCGRLGNGSPPFDPLQIAIDEAHARGIQLHAWVNALPGWASPRQNNAAFCSLLVESRPGSPRHMLQIGRAHV
jgi:uncharacterized lipoprotein YddW (UPF0748 family)